MTAPKKKDPRLQPIADLAVVCYGPKWMSSVADVAGVHRSLISAIMKGDRGLTLLVYVKIVAALDAKISFMESDVTKAMMLRDKLK